MTMMSWQDAVNAKHQLDCIELGKHTPMFAVEFRQMPPQSFVSDPNASKGGGDSMIVCECGPHALY